jgi:hypothetical protein
LVFDFVGPERFLNLDFIQEGRSKFLPRGFFQKKGGAGLTKEWEVASVLCGLAENPHG